LKAKLLSSHAYFRQRGGGNGAGFVQAAFGDTRHRAPTPTELRRGVGLLGGGTPRPVVAAALVREGATTAAVVRYWYQRLLDRPPTRAEARLWGAGLARGGRLEAFLRNLVTSREFLRRVT
jgi:hypothetical protein